MLKNVSISEPIQKLTDTPFRLDTENEFIPTAFYDHYVTLCPKGKLGQSTEYNLYDYHVIPSPDLGSLRFKLHLPNIGDLSLFVFLSGSIKISGPLPPTEIMEAIGGTVQDGFERYVNDISKFVERIFHFYPVTPDVTLLNGQFEIEKPIGKLFEFSFEIAKKMRSKETSFQRLVEPDWELPGRRGALKLYAYHERNFHVAFDSKSKVVQIFSARSFDEMNFIRNELLLLIK